MNFDITPDNQPYLNARGKIVLNACPGSGKTTAIAYKLNQLTSECQEQYGDFAGIACLSFTNVAKSEIATKYHLLSGSYLSYPHEVRTLDSFVNQFITLPFYYLLDRPVKRPVVMDVVSFLDDMTLGHFPSISGQPLSRIFKPSKLRFELDGTISWDGIIPQPTKVDGGVFEKYAKAFKVWQLNKGYLNNDDSTYIAYKLLKKHPEIRKNLAARFPYIIVDEAQDTSAIQYAIFDELISAGLCNIEYVGDPYQSLYEFREARPDLFISRYKDTANWQPLQLTNCRRSSQKIIDIYSLFRDTAERPIISTCKHVSDHSVKVLRYDPNNVADLVTRYQTVIDPTLESYVLVRGSTHLEMFGAKPSSEKPWKNEVARTLVDAYIYFERGNVKNAVDAVRMFLTEVQLPDGTHKDKRNHRDMLKEDSELNIQLFDFLREMPTIDDTLKGWTEKIAQLIKERFKVTVDLGLKQKGLKFYQQNLKALLFPQIAVAYPVNTIHKVKGMTFGAVLLVLSENSVGANISLNDFKRATGLPTEKQRIIYVALSRPEIHACIAIPNVLSEAEIIKVIGDKIEFI